MGQFLVEKSPRAALRAVSTIEAALISLQYLPARSPMRLEDQRELMIPFNSSGYVVRYRVDADVVVIARIFHMREER
ncbi:type II toxin-antitoxin system RelE/ParE family toxin [Brevundimonas staleyi]|uniref:type II toxin-antitoxin system RelE/ParE family toxin n=1 Tax=Brevundimonas staleyi TaxID=74326 RepID=UPI0035A6EB43